MMLEIMSGDRTIGQFDDGTSEQEHIEAFAGPVEESVLNLLEIREAIWDGIHQDAQNVGMDLCRDRFESSYARDLTKAITLLFDEFGYLFGPDTHAFYKGKQQRSVHNYG